MTEHQETENERWMLYCSVSDINWKTHIKELTLEEVEYCLKKETRKTAIKQFEAKRRELLKKVIIPLPGEDEPLGLVRGSTEVVNVGGKWTWWGDWEHVPLGMIEHNAIRLRQLCEQFGRYLPGCFGAHKDYDDDYFYLMTTSSARLEIDHPWVKKGIAKTSSNEKINQIFSTETHWRGPNYGGGYFEWDVRPPVEPEVMPTEKDCSPVASTLFPIPEGAIMPPPKPEEPKPVIEFTGNSPLKDDDAKKTKQLTLF